MIERLRVRIPAGAAGEFSSQGLSLCADSSYSVSVPPSATAVARKDFSNSARSAGRAVAPEHAYTLDPTKSEWADYAAQI